MSNVSRREFVKVGVATVTLLATAGTVTAAEKEIKADELKKKLLGDKKFRPLKLNRKQAEERYEQLLARVPEKYRPTVKLPEGAVNRKAEVLKAWEKYQDYPAYHLGTLDPESDEYLQKSDQYYMEYSVDDVTIRPFTDDAVFQRIQQWLTAQKPHYEKLVALANDRDYCSEHEQTDLHFYPLEDFQLSDLITIHRRFVWHIQHLSLVAARQKEWEQLPKLIDQALHYYKFISHGKLLLVDHIIVNYILVINYEIVLRMLLYPELPSQIAAQLFQKIQNLEKQLADPRPTMVMETFQFSLSQLAAIPECKQAVNQSLAMLGFGQEGQSELELKRVENKNDADNKFQIEDFYLNYYMLDILTNFELGKLLENHPQPYDAEATFQLWLTEQTSWLDFYDLHRDQYPFPKYKSPQAEQAWLQKVPHFLLFSEKQTELKKLQALANLNGFDRLEWCEKLDKITNPLGKLYVAPINIRERDEKPRTHSAAASYEIMVTGVKQGQTRLAVLAAACLIYERQHQHLPEQLAELVKLKILPALPIDPSSGKDFQYDSAKRLLWGANGLDPKTGELQEYYENTLSNTLGIQVIPKILPRPEKVKE